jgi:hypothetical protein
MNASKTIIGKFTVAANAYNEKTIVIVQPFNLKEFELCLLMTPCINSKFFLYS